MFEPRDRNSKEVDKQKSQVEEFQLSGTVNSKALGQDVLSLTRNRKQATTAW